VVAHVLAEQLAEARHDRRQAELVLRPVLGPALRRARAGTSAAEFGACSAPSRGQQGLLTAMQQRRSAVKERAGMGVAECLLSSGRCSSGAVLSRQTPQ